MSASTNVRRASTLHDVAARVGVSARTVSRVVNDEGGFSEATRGRVQQAIDELAYRPNALARGLITRRSRTIALVTPVLSDPFFPELAEGVQRAARKAGLTVLFATSDDSADVQGDLLDSLASHSPDGVVIFPWGERADALQRHLDSGMRMVIIDTDYEHENAAVLSSDLVGGAASAVERLVERGCQKIAMITNGSSPAENRRRESSYVASLPSSMQPIIEPVVPNIDGGRIGARRLIDRAPDVDGIFAYNDVTAIGAMETLRRSGRSIPGDVAVVGCDDIAMGEVVTPSLTTIRIDRDRLGSEAVRLIEAMANEQPVEAKTLLPVELVIRESA